MPIAARRKRNSPRRGRRLARIAPLQQDGEFARNKKRAACWSNTRSPDSIGLKYALLFALWHRELAACGAMRRNPSIV